MINLLKAIVQTMASLLIFVSHAITSLIKLFIHLPEYMAFINTSFTVLPTIVIPFALASVALYAVFFVLGRQ